MTTTKTILGYTVRDAEVQSKEPVDSAEKALPFLEDYRARDREHLIALFLNARQQVIAVDVISVGTLTASLVHPREFFKGAIMFNAAAVIMAHNHNSGDPTPSQEDKDTTKRMIKAGELLGIPFLDHVIITPAKGVYFSFREAGLI